MNPLPKARPVEAKQSRVWLAPIDDLHHGTVEDETRPVEEHRVVADHRFCWMSHFLPRSGASCRHWWRPGSRRLRTCVLTLALLRVGNNCRDREPPLLSPPPCPRSLDDTLDQGTRASGEQLEGWTLCVRSTTATSRTPSALASETTLCRLGTWLQVLRPSKSVQEYWRRGELRPLPRLLPSARHLSMCSSAVNLVCH